MKKHFDKYMKLVEEVQTQSNRLHKVHEEHTQCKKGCDHCCMDYSIFPVEFYFILDEILNHSKTLPLRSDSAEKCVFLVDHACSIYSNRPIICRTHGLPLIFMNDDDQWELSTCDLNFKDYSPDRFSIENTMEIDTFNSKLFQINKSFIEEYPHIRYSETDLIPIRELKAKLESN